MKSKRLLALLLAFCMVMALVPAFALGSSADSLPTIALPQQGKKTNLLTVANFDNFWKYNTTINSDGSLTIAGSADWGKEAWQETCSYVASDVSALTGKDYVVSWRQTLLSYADDGPHLMTRVGSTTDGVIMLVTTSDKIYINFGGKLTQISDVDKTSAATYAVYVRKATDALTELFIYADDVLVGTYSYAGAVSPIFGQSYKGCYWAGDCTISDYAMYDATPELPLIGKKTNYLSAANFDNFWKFNTTINNDGSVTVADGATWGNDAWQESCSYVASDVSGLNGKNYVVTWTQTMLSYADGGPHMMTRVGSTSDGVIMLVTASSYTAIRFGSQLLTISTETHTNSATYAVYVSKDNATNTNLYIFAGGKYIGTFSYAGTVSPIYGQSWKGCGWAGSCTVSDYAMYDDEPVVDIEQVPMPTMTGVDNALSVGYLSNPWCNDVTFKGGNVDFNIGATGNWSANAFNDYHGCVGHNANGLVAGGSFAISWTQVNPEGDNLSAAMSMRIGGLTSQNAILHITASATQTALFIGQNGTLIPLDEGHKGKTSYCVYVRKESEAGASTVYVYVNGEQIGGMHFNELPSAYFGLSWNGFYYMEGVFTDVAMFEAPDGPALTDPDAPVENLMPKNAYNYAIGVEGITVNTNHAYDDVNGYMQLECNNWNQPAVTLMVNGIEKTDDYVVSYYNRKSDSWGQADTVFTFGSEGDKTQSVVFSGGGRNSNYIDENGVEHDLGLLVASGACEAGCRFTIHFKKNDDGTHNVELFVKGKYKATIANVTALTPSFTFRSTYNNNDYGNTILGLRIFKTDANATQFEDYQTNSILQTSGITPPPSTEPVVPGTGEEDEPTVEPDIPENEDADDPQWNDSNLAMPSDATNFVTENNLIATGNEPAVYYGGSLVLIPRKTFDSLYGNGQAKVLLSDACSTTKPYAMSFWTHVSIGADANAFYSVRFLSDESGNYYELHIRSDYVSVFKNGTTELDRFTLPSTGQALMDVPLNTVAGVWKNFMLYMKPSTTAGNVTISMFIDGEQMVNEHSVATMEITANKFEMIFGTSHVDFTARGLRFYKVNGHAASFAAEIDPDAEINNAPNGVAGKDGGTGFLANMNPMAAVPTKKLLLPVYDPSEGEPERSTECPESTEDMPDFALDAEATEETSAYHYQSDCVAMELVSANNWKSPIVSLDIKGINADDDFCIAFLYTRPGKIHTNYPFKLTFSSDGNRTEMFSFTPKGTTYFAADGTSKFLPALTDDADTWESGLWITVHCYPDAHGTRTIDLFSDDTMIARLKNQALLPFAFQMEGAPDRDCPMSITEIDVFKMDDAGSTTDGLSIVGIKDGYEYEEDRYFTVNGAVSSVTINGQKATSVGNSTYLVKTGTKGTYNIVATDKKGKSVSMTVTSNSRTKYTISIGWTNMYYRIVGCYDAGALPYTGPQTFHAYEGETVKIIPEESLEWYGSVKKADASWTWITNGAYSFTAVEDRSFIVQGFDNPTLTLEIEGEGTVSGVNNGDYLWHESFFTVTAVPAKGWKFDHWVWGEQISTNITQEYNIGLFPGTLKVVFVPAEETYDVTIKNVDGGTGSGAATELPYGSSVNLTAVANDGFTFAYWLINGRMYTDKDITFVVNCDVVAVPVFHADAPESFFIHFYTADGRLVMTADSASFDPATDLPTVPERYGYVANGWDYVWEDGITSDMDVFPQYIRASELYTITVNGGSVNKTSVQFETLIVVTASVKDGFIGWKDAGGHFVSLKPQFTFFAVEDIELTAVYEGKQPDYYINVTDKSKNESTSDEKYTINIVGNTFVSEEYTLLERGVIYGVGEFTTDTLVLNGANVTKRASSTTKNGQFMYTLKNAPKNTTITARAYMIITNGDEQMAVYSDLCDCTFDA